MKEKLKSPHGLKPQGVGPKIFRSALPFLVVGILAGIFLPQIVKIPLYHRIAFITAGIIMLVLGSGIYLASMIQFIRDFPKGILITRGVYRLSRNPLYSSWILFIFPGLALVCNNWVFLLAALSMYVAFSTLIKVEEEQLLSVFGAEYEKYCRRVGRLSLYPFGR
jgi:protein-S-isoprenylcysteine O-methyltransferase Ste14